MMGFWHTGYAEFHEPTGLDGVVYLPPPIVRYSCEYCSEKFFNLEDLRRHRFEQHPLRQPALFIRGRAVGTLPLSILAVLVSRDIVVEDATRCLLNGLSISPKTLGEHLQSMTREFVEIELSNSGVRTRFVLDFRVAQLEHLAGIEASFLRMARDRVLSINAISGFIQDCRVFDSAMAYCDGICHYLYGVMAKEKAIDTGLRPIQYIERYSRASSELSDFDRPLARNIQAIIAFHFNQFDDAKFLLSDGVLKLTSGSFSRLLRGNIWSVEPTTLSNSNQAVESLLTDQETLKILSDANYSLVELADRAEVLQMEIRRTTSGYDRLKRILLAGEAFAARNDAAAHDIARRLVRELAAQSDVVVWAEKMLERLNRL